MNEITKQRDIETVTNEIISLRSQAQQTALTYAVEIGRRLAEAKSIVPHGEWGGWLANRVEFKQRTANNFIRIFEEYGSGQLSLFADSSNSQPVANLKYTQLLALLALPTDERESFVEENDVESMTKRELEKAVKERKEALKRAQEAERRAELADAANEKAERSEKLAAMSAERAETAEKELAVIKEALDKAKVAEKKAKERLSQLKKNPVVPDELADRLKAEAQAEAAEKAAREIEEKTAELAGELKNAKEAAQRAEAEAAEQRNRAAGLEKKLKMQNPEVESFKRLFEQAQENMKAITQTITRLKENNAELAERFSAAVQAFLSKYETAIGGKADVQN